MKLAYTTEGAASHPPLVFLHGFMGSSLDWTPVVDALSGSYYCVLPDLPGHGQSSGLQPISFDRTIQWLAEMLASLDIETFALVGYSMGGRVAMALAEHMPDRIRGLILESANPGLESEDARAERLAADASRAEQLEQISIEAFVRQWYSLPMFANLQDRPELLSSLMDARTLNDADGLARAMRGLSVGEQQSFWSFMARPPFPVLAIAGGLDTAYTAMCNRLTLAGKIIVPEAGHNVHLENPAAYIKAVTHFLNEIAER